MVLDILLPIGTIAILLGLVNVYSTKSQWAIFEKFYTKPRYNKFIFGAVYGLVAGSLLFLLNWNFVVLGALSFAFVASLIYKKDLRIFKYALILGVFLMVFDWVVENIGAMLNFWYSFNSSFFVLAVPIEVMIAAVLGGFAFALFMPRKFNLKYILLVSLLVGIGGAFGESRLQLIGLMTYGGGWFWPHAVISYFLTWVLLSIVWYKVLLRH